MNYEKSGHVKKVCRLGPDKCSECNYDTHHDLFVCEVCGGAESELPSECPGRSMTEKECDDVREGRLDYNNGQWIDGRC